MSFHIGFSIIIIWFLIGLIFLGGLFVSEAFEAFFDAHPNIPFIYYLSWFPTIIIAGWLMKKGGNA